MKSLSLLGELVTADGANLAHGFNMFGRPQSKVWAIPGSELRAIQRPIIPLRPGHGEPGFGIITHLERRKGAVWAVGELDPGVQLPTDRELFLSVEALFDAGPVGKDVLIRGAAICTRSRMLGVRPLLLVPDGRLPERQVDWKRDMYLQARKQRPGLPLVVRDEPDHIELRQPVGTRYGRVERSRHPGRILSVT